VAQEVEAAVRSDGGCAGKGGSRKAQIKKSRRYRNDRAGSSNKEWLYKQMLYSKD